MPIRGEKGDLSLIWAFTPKSKAAVALFGYLIIRCWGAAYFKFEE